MRTVLLVLAGTWLCCWAAQAQQPRPSEATTAAPKFHAGKMVAENDLAVMNVIKASESMACIGIYVETSTKQEAGSSAGEWAKAIEKGLNRRGNVTCTEVRGGTSLYEPGTITLLVKGDIAWTGNITKFEPDASRLLDLVDAKQEGFRKRAGKPPDTFRPKRSR